jgi:hypothetical protein
VHDVRTSQKHTYSPPRHVTGIALHFCMYMMFVPRRKHKYRPPQLGTRTASVVYMYMAFVPHRKYMYEPQMSVTGIALHFYMYMIFVPRRKHKYRPPQLGTRTASLYILSRIPRLCGSVTNNSTWIRIGYRIYSLWRFITTQITITSY